MLCLCHFYFIFIPFVLLALLVPKPCTPTLSLVSSLTWNHRQSECADVVRSVCVTVVGVFMCLRQFVFTFFCSFHHLLPALHALSSSDIAFKVSRQSERAGTWLQAVECVSFVATHTDAYTHTNKDRICALNCVTHTSTLTHVYLSLIAHTEPA